MPPERLPVSLAQSIVDRAMAIIHSNVNVMDHHGVIIASGDPARIGAQHEGAMRVLAQGCSVEIASNARARRSSIKPRLARTSLITYLFCQYSAPEADVMTSRPSVVIVSLA